MEEQRQDPPLGDTTGDEEEDEQEDEEELVSEGSSSCWYGYAIWYSPMGLAGEGEIGFA